MQVKGLEVPLHEPRLKQGMGLLYAVNAYGADHTVGMHDTFYVAEGTPLDGVRPLGVLEPLRTDDLGPGKVFLAKLAHQWRYFLDCIGLCYFVPYDYEQTAEIVSAATGWNTTVREAMKVGERAVTISRAFNMREGLTAADDWLPARCFHPTSSGPLRETAIDPEALKEAIHTFYQMMGWQRETGVPTREKLKELGISWVVEKLGETRC